MDAAKGGLSQALRTMIPALTTLGVRNTVVCMDEPQATKLNTDAFEIIMLGSKGPWAYSKSLLPWLQKNAAAFDVVVVHGLWLYNSFAGYKATKLINSRSGHKSIKMVVMPHGMLDPYFQKAKGRKLKAIRNWLFWKLVEGRVVNNADALFFTCQKELMLARIPFTPYHPKRELNVGLGVDEPPKFEAGMQEAIESKFPQIKSQLYLLFLSRLHPKKGLHLLIEAYINIASNKNNQTVLPLLMIAGPGLETGYAQQLQKRVQQTPAASDKIIFTGMLTGATKWGAFYGCEAFVLPSSQENFGIAVVEALACSKPVLIANQINICDEIAQGSGGIVMPDTQQGTQQMLQQWMHMDNQQKLEMGTNARIIYQQKFEASAAANNFYMALTLLMSRANNPSTYK